LGGAAFRFPLPEDNSNRISGFVMKTFSVLLSAIIFVSASSYLKAGEVILYGGLQKPGEIEHASEVNVPKNLLEGQFGSAYGIRFNGTRKASLEENISYSPHFAKRGVKAFQMDTNLVVQARTRITPYLTTGIGFIHTWGQSSPADSDPLKTAAHDFSFGKKFSVNYGAGIKVRKVVGSLGLNIDIRRYTVLGVHDGTLSFYQTSLGAMFSW
jgi:hypothetical protein